MRFAPEEPVRVHNAALVVGQAGKRLGVANEEIVQVGLDCEGEVAGLLYDHVLPVCLDCALDGGPGR